MILLFSTLHMKESGHMYPAFFSFTSDILILPQEERKM